ncbi:MAG: fructosamine kinase family protein [Bacteroidales bacterium]|nr:fructosamine kinase family protein [Bacteroidales bacterium]
MLPDELKKAVESTLSAQFKKQIEISEIRSIGGGCINEACSLKTNISKFFIKYNSASTYPGMFEKEAAGLKILADTKTIEIPEVISSAETGEYAYILLRYIETGVSSRNFWDDFGTKLADLHRNTNEYFGLDHDNYIGSLVQKNTPHPDFFGFFISERIEPQLKEARNKGAFSQSETRYFDSLFNTLPDIIPVDQPALIHGDLWSGNYMITASGSPCLVDPAVYYGHREADIAMTQLFGGFQPEFYHAYNHAWPMEKDWQKRMDIFNLYPLLVHVNLFGGSYARQVLQIIRQF